MTTKDYTTIEAIKQQCRNLIDTLDAYQPGRIAARLMWIDGAWGDYWYIEQDGQPLGDIYYDGFGPRINGDALGELVYSASRAAESVAKAA